MSEFNKRVIDDVAYIGYYVNATLGGIQYISTKESLLPFSAESRVVVTRPFLQGEKGNSQPHFYVFNKEDLDAVARELSFDHESIRVVADARILGVYRNAACVIKRKLSDFYTDITPAMDAEVDW